MGGLLQSDQIGIGGSDLTCYQLRAQLWIGTDDLVDRLRDSFRERQCD
jgi:hypothetical protein